MIDPEGEIPIVFIMIAGYGVGAIAEITQDSLREGQLTFESDAFTAGTRGALQAGATAALGPVTALLGVFGVNFAFEFGDTQNVEESIKSGVEETVEYVTLPSAGDTAIDIFQGSVITGTDSSDNEVDDER